MSDITSVGKVYIEKLKDSKNYPTWCAFVREPLRREDLLAFVTDNPPDPEATTPTVLSRWKKRTPKSNLSSSCTLVPKQHQCHFYLGHRSHNQRILP